MVPFRYFHSGALPESLPSFDHDAPEDVCGDRTWSYSPLKSPKLCQIFNMNLSVDYFQFCSDLIFCLVFFYGVLALFLLIQYKIYTIYICRDHYIYTKGK